MTSAVIDRLVDRYCHIVNFRGNSYRMRRHTDLLQLLSPQSPPSRRQQAPTPWARPPRQECAVFADE